MPDGLTAHADAHGAVHVHAHHPAHAHHFETMEQQQEAATLGMWIFLVTEVMFFGGLFMAYLLYRTLYPEAWLAGSHELNEVLGGINTVVLICSSLTMALAVRAAQVGSRNGQIVNLILTIIFGVTFLVVKYFEYAAKFEHHLVPGAHFDPARDPAQQLYFSLYFMMTGVHALHMVVGVILMLIILRMAWKGQFGPGYFAPVEISGLYWHFVDIVWIFLFPLLYLIGKHH